MCVCNMPVCCSAPTAISVALNPPSHKNVKLTKKLKDRISKPRSHGLMHIRIFLAFSGEAARHNMIHREPEHELLPNLSESYSHCGDGKIELS